ncbi:MAG: YfiR family protein, partial [Planctomycetota bacterium]|nr:YfiR family protein [Planctomycetota bacterium]
MNNKVNSICRDHIDLNIIWLRSMTPTPIKTYAVRARVCRAGNPSEPFALAAVHTYDGTIVPSSSRNGTMVPFYASAFGFAKFSSTARRMAVIVVLLLLVIPNSVARSQPSPEANDREATLKAAYIYKFIKYVKWPATAFQQPTSPLVIGVTGESPVSNVLRVIVRAKSNSSTRPLRFVDVNTITEARACHILFFSKNAADSSLIGKLKEVPVFLVGETDTFLKGGGMMEFQVANNKIRLRLSMETVKRHQLT